jgi:beta-lactamase class A
MQRDAFLASTFAAAVARAGAAPEQLRAIEARTGGRLGVSVVDTGSGLHSSYRSGERFPMCSTFKLLAVGAVLARVDARREQLERHIQYTKRDLLAYAPVTTKHVGAGFMTVGALCEAAIEWSDNTAANLLLGTLDGPPGWTRFARSLGDPTSTLNRIEPELNTAIPGDARDTTTPFAMAQNMRKLLLGEVLSRASRKRLTTWLANCRTGTDCIRAGIPKSWRAGDKTGSGANGTHNDIAMLWPPHRAPIIVTAYLTGSKLSDDATTAVLAEVGRYSSKL